MALSKKTRFEVFKRDRFTCTYCGKRPPDVMLEVDHIHPRAEGGTDDPANLTTSCLACNRGKGATPLGTLVPAIDEEALLEGMQEALERATALKQALNVSRAKADAEAEAVAMVRAWYLDVIGGDFYVEDRTIRRFLRHLPLDEIRAAIDTTAAAASWKRLSKAAQWKYFCGVCWTKIRESGEAPRG